MNTYEWPTGALLPTPHVLHWYDWRSQIKTESFERWLARAAEQLRHVMAARIERAAEELGLEGFKSRLTQ